MGRCVVCMDKPAMVHGFTTNISEYGRNCLFTKCRRCKQCAVCQECANELSFEFATRDEGESYVYTGMFMFKCPLCRAMTYYGKERIPPKTGVWTRKDHHTHNMLSLMLLMSVINAEDDLLDGLLKCGLTLDVGIIQQLEGLAVMSMNTHATSRLRDWWLNGDVEC